MTRWRDPVERFLERVNRAGPLRSPYLGPCWLWVGVCRKDGYAEFSAQSAQRLAHRWSYETFVGPIPEGLHIDHLCRVRNCVNPAHLEAVTDGENKRRGNGVAAINARKTHCKRGHEFTVENTVILSGGRECRACKLQHQAVWRAKKRAERTMR